MRTDLVRLDLSLRRWSLLWYAAGTAAYTLAVVVLYPQFRTTTSLNSLTKGGSTAAALFGLTGSLTSPSGWLNANIYENFLPIVMLLLTVGYGAAAVAGQDEDGTLALLAVLPLRRDGVLAQKAGALAVQALALTVPVGLIVLIGRSFQLAIAPSRIFGITVTTFLLGVDFGFVALAIGAATGRRVLTIGATAALAAVSYLLSSLAPVVDWIQPVRYLSPVYWSVGDDQLGTGATAADFAVLIAVGVAALVAATFAFRRLDLH